MKKSTIIVIVVIVLIAIWGITSYNGMVKLRKECNLLEMSVG